MFRIGIVTASDKGARGKREDVSGKRIADMLAYLGEIKRYIVLPDECRQLSDAMIDMADNLGVDLILTTGGVGVGARDVTPEATLAVIDRQVPGIPEAMRAVLMEMSPRGMLSRAVAGIRGRTLIINLPGSPKGIEACLEVILPSLAHGLPILKGEDGDLLKA